MARITRGHRPGRGTGDPRAALRLALHCGTARSHRGVVITASSSRCRHRGFVIAASSSRCRHHGFVITVFAEGTTPGLNVLASHVATIANFHQRPVPACHEVHTDSPSGQTACQRARHHRDHGPSQGQIPRKPAQSRSSKRPPTCDRPFDTCPLPGPRPAPFASRAAPRTTPLARSPPQSRPARRHPRYIDCLHVESL